MSAVVERKSEQDWLVVLQERPLVVERPTQVTVRVRAQLRELYIFG
jgi:hypothetical protein